MKKKVQHLSKTYYESHNIDNSFTSGLKYQFQNTSLSKFAEVKKQQLTHQKTIKKTQEKVEKNKVRKRNLVLRFASMEARLKSANSKLQDLKSLDEQMEASSILIQKVFKGFITRKRLENV